ncbi:MAG TPA: cyclase family protein [Candidatus Sulfotelmatobacter sp.]|nr:cyclase family protein [Candidatus Sulfotelmatobacter sp.]
MPASHPDRRGFRIIDLSDTLQNSGTEPLPIEVTYMDHRQTAASPLLQQYGVTPADLPDGLGYGMEILRLSTHSGTHVDAPWHYFPTSEGRPSRTIDQIPLEWCYGNGVRLDFRHKQAGEAIEVADLQGALRKIRYRLRPYDIVLIWTGTSRFFGTADYENQHPGMTRASTLWLIEQGIRVMGIDAWGWDRPFRTMSEELKAGVKGRWWEAHYAGREGEYLQVERLNNLERLPGPTGYTVAVFPARIAGASGGWTRAVAIVRARGARPAARGAAPAARPARRRRPLKARRAAVSRRMARRR